MPSLDPATPPISGALSYACGVTEPSTPEQPWPVRVVSQKVGAWIARLGWVWVDGQVAQITRRPGTTTVFLTLRDPSADISLTVTTNRDVLDLGAPNLTDGARVLLHAKPDFYPARGTLSLRADEIRQVGLGELLARLEQLKKLLAAEGLFDPARKRRPPFLPARIGLITGRASAAERDVLTNSRRRWPAVEFRVVNVAVQGPTAVPQMIDALKVLDADASIDVIVIARGGGSTEDLLPFSDEALCRAVFACRTPVVSAVGHETDTPLLDYVADVRASTPTDAAKRLVPDLGEEVRLIREARHRLTRAVRQLVDREQHRLDAVRSRPALARPYLMVDQRQADVAALVERSRRTLGHRLSAADSDLAHTLARLRALSPAATLQRGYAIVQTASGAIVRAPADVAAGDALRLRLADGDLAATVAAS
ncbi:MAG TPA: exodeoxyribonuclease VII large subunit [Micromonosporaceae bacterium]|jgi:exodeoxyribonuclease VII large subunit|nr:exodeoxyribonuclease VII large subunit [Micromonosporaceae bacterium]